MTPRTSLRAVGHAFWLAACRPGYNGIKVARTLGSSNGPDSSCTSPLGSSTLLPMMPRGLCSLKLRPTISMPLASSAAASVSPSSPSYGFPSKLNPTFRRGGVVGLPNTGTRSSGFMDTSCGSLAAFATLAVSRNGVEGKHTAQRVAYSVALDAKPLSAAERMSPTLKGVPTHVRARKEVVGPLLVREFPRLGGTNAVQRSAESELVFVSRAAAVWARNSQHDSSRLMVHAGGRGFIDETPRRETIHPKRLDERMGPIIGHGMGKRFPTDGNGLETARPPTRTDIQRRNRRLAENRTRIGRDVDDAGPLPHQLEAAERRKQVQCGAQRVLESGKRAALAVRRVGIGAAADQDFATVRLAHIAVHEGRHDKAIQDRLDRFADHRLQRHAVDRQGDAGHPGEHRRMACDSDDDLVGLDVASLRFHATDPVFVHAQARHLAVLNDVDPEAVRAARIAPCHRVMPRNARATLNEPAKNRVACARTRVQHRHEFPDLVELEHFGIDALQADGVGPPLEPVHLMRTVRERQRTVLTQHDVVVQFLAQALVQLQRALEKVRALGIEVVRADGCCVAPGIAASQPALFEHRDIGDAMVLRKVIRRGEALTSATDDDDVIPRFGFAGAPRRRPVAVARQRMLGERPE